MDWILQYNEFFNALPKKEEGGYFKGSEFIKIIKEFKPAFPSYGKYIQYRQDKDLYTSRKEYYFDILSDFDSDARKEIMERCNQLVKEKKEGK